jgi:hypothetical protein
MAVASGLARPARGDRAPSHATDDTVGRLDELSQRAWAKAGVVPTERADNLKVARRLSLALTGTIPSLEELRWLQRLDEGDRLPRYLDRLLADRRFADYFAERLARAYVGTHSGPLLVYRRRRFVYWLSDAIARDRPYDGLVRELVSSNGLWTDKPGTNFITAHERDPVQLAARSARAFLGVRMDCAQCHDHPFAHWKQRDFEGLAAHYAGIEQNITGIHDGDGRFKPGGRMMMMGDAPAAEPRVPFAREAASDEGTRRQRLAHWITSGDNPNFGRAIANRVWALMFGRGLTRSGVDDIEGEELIEGMLDALDDDFRRHGHHLKRLVRVIGLSRAFRLQSGSATAASKAQHERFAAFPISRLRAEQIAGALVQMSSLATIDADSHIVWRLMRAGSTRDFVRRFGDAGEVELEPQAGTLMQRLVMMNGKVVRERTEPNPFSASGRIAMLAPSDEQRVRIAFLMALSRQPSELELTHFVEQLRDKKGKPRARAMHDMMWALVNSTEFSWNH